MMIKTVAAIAALVCVAGACGVTDEDTQTSEPAIDAAAQAVSTAGVCWRRTTTRGAGTLPTDCANADRSGALCYPRCPAGFAGVGPVCWQSCPAGYRDDGALCRRDASLVSADNSRCPWYDKCGITLAKGCSKCPDGYANDGCVCRRDVHIFAKATRTRGAGWTLGCAPGLDMDAGLCYPACPAGSQGKGPVCWLSCSSEMPIMCGAGCAKSQEACAKATSEQVLKTVETVVSALKRDLPGAIAKGIAAANAFNLPLCEAGP
jgi:hypothetical protein